MSNPSLWELKLQKATRSAIVVIRNDTEHTLLREPLQPALFGAFVELPAEVIAPKSESRFGLISNKLMTGCECEVAFVAKDAPHWGQVQLHVDVNYIGDNRVLCESPQAHLKVEHIHNGLHAHNFEVTFVIRDVAPARALSVPKATLAGAAAEQRGASANAAPKSPRRTVEAQQWKSKLKDAPRSVLVAINNRTAHDFTRRTCDVYHGVWGKAPPEKLAANDCVEFGTASDAALVGTDGRAVYESTTDRSLTLVIAWDLSFVKPLDCSARASLPTIAALKYVNGGHNAEVVFEIQPNDGHGKPVFGHPYATIVAAHGGSVLPRPLLDIVCQITRNGTSAANRGLFTGVPSFVELKELRSGVSLDKPLDLERFSPASLGAVVKMFLVELDDRPIAPLLEAYAGGDPTSAGTAEARLLLKVLVELFASCSVVAPQNAAHADDAMLVSTAVLPPVQPRVSEGDNSTRSLTSHEIATIFAPILAASSPKESHTLREMDDALRSFREIVAVLAMLIETQILRNDEQRRRSE
jgi:hypothetical protein